MKASRHGAAVVLTAVAALAMLPHAVLAQAKKPAQSSTARQDRTMPASDREKVSYAIGLDMGGWLKPVAPDVDLAALEAAMRHVLGGGQPALAPAEAEALDRTLRARAAARQGTGGGGGDAAIDRARVGTMLGSYMIAPALSRVRDELDIAMFLQGLKAELQGGARAMTPDEVRTVLTAFNQRMQARLQAEAAAAGERNRTEGAAFLEKNRQAEGVVTLPSGMQYKVLRPAFGDRPRASDTVEVHYRGTLLDGTEFDSSYGRGQTATFPLTRVIRGWTEGIPLMPVGAKYRFWIPGDLAYGAGGTPDGKIGPNATLVFDVELESIRK